MVDLLSKLYIVEKNIPILIDKLIHRCNTQKLNQEYYTLLWVGPNDWIYSGSDIAFNYRSDPKLHYHIFRVIINGKLINEHIGRRLPSKYFL